jgi:hypothetical protein
MRRYVQGRRNRNKLEQQNRRTMQQNPKCHPFSLPRLKLNSRQPLPAFVFDSFTIRKSSANNTKFEVKIVLVKWGDNRCDRVRDRDGSRRRHHKNWWPKLHRAFPIKNRVQAERASIEHFSCACEPVYVAAQAWEMPYCMHPNLPRSPQRPETIVVRQSAVSTTRSEARR